MTDAIRALPPWDDPRVQVVYALLCDWPDPPDGEHWEGWVARNIIAALEATASASQSPAHLGNQEGDSQ
jgi:phosphatidylethanolamine-binding protein (PEBP) family uncharacterized protein